MLEAEYDTIKDASDAEALFHYAYNAELGNKRIDPEQFYPSFTVADGIVRVNYYLEAKQITNSTATLLLLSIPDFASSQIKTVNGLLAQFRSLAFITYAIDSPTSAMFVTPMTQKIILEPGETFRGNISVSNGASSPEVLHYNVSVGSYTQLSSEDSKDDYGGFGVDVRSSHNIMMDRISLGKTSGIIEPNGTDTIDFSIKVPEDAPAGAQYATILISSADNDKTETNSAVIKSKVQLASAIFANVAGENRKEAKITENNIPSFAAWESFLKSV